MPLGDTQPPRGLVRLLLRVPIGLYRLHLGCVLGQRFLLLTHTGRKTGLPRQTVLEVVDYDASMGTYITASAWGVKADWLRNIERTPHVRVQVGKCHFAATARRLSNATAQRALLRYGQRHPLAFRVLAIWMVGQRFRGTAEDCATLAQSVPLVALQCKTRVAEAGYGRRLFEGYLS